MSLTEENVITFVPEPLFTYIKGLITPKIEASKVPNGPTHLQAHKDTRYMNLQCSFETYAVGKLPKDTHAVTSR